MNKGKLIELVSKDTGISKALADDVLKSILGHVMKSLKSGERVTFVGFGSFTVTDRAARVARNPQSGELMKIKARRAPKFKAGKEFSAMIAKK